MIRHSLFATFFLFSFAAVVLAEDTASENSAAETSAAENVVSEIEEATAQLDTRVYELKYKFTPGEEIRYVVVHRATVDTKIEGNREVSKSRSASTKVWKVESVEDDVIKFAFFIEDVDMWQQSDGRDEVRYNSLKDDEVPTQYKHVADSIGKSLAVVNVDSWGRILSRESGKSNPDLGFGAIIFPLPKGEVPIGHTWSTPKTLKLRERDGRIKLVKIQLRHRLEKVSLGIATISIQTQILTPIASAQLKSQLVQQLSNGTVRFDMDAGRVLSKVLDWTETVIGFNGAACKRPHCLAAC